MTNLDKLKENWLKSEEKQKQFIGWDFSYLKNKYAMDPLPWDYRQLVLKELKPDMRLLDMGTGGGELLRSFHHPYGLTSVTEGWKKNYVLLLERLAPLGVNVQFVAEDDQLLFPDHSFDIVLNSHESFSIDEVKHVLKPGGFFITQQVGDMNGLLLASKLIPGLKKVRFDLHLSSIVPALEAKGFSIHYQNEAYPKQLFLDMDGLIYYVHTIPWEFTNFNVHTHFDQLLFLHEELARNQFILNLEHRFVVVSQLKV
ncbi:class I SAM-dependent methyltransferase [Marinilactibacillus kalidii]|uniref:class I SAM-dependent methyltransferase n=1 Tax=Marinilactibacillus kalidii TaxID=2820274 RepID=UPI001ABE4C70|nr:class I SAM-dependent methyltransferase [Marinilactibacillus kalidii]